ncbi:MAG: hypothetical protein A3G24_07425 [Betaproteobacteria bacterium RIFCSPLOWO2_12_FULL_62_13]|nr:MAG: hypothetical protein A3G24_07425 [Betaproteobacteria bacterium RIFCSPLOWO2_12_FULL_62_13]
MRKIGLEEERFLAAEHLSCPLPRRNFRRLEAIEGEKHNRIGRLHRMYRFSRVLTADPNWPQTIPGVSAAHQSP